MPGNVTNGRSDPLWYKDAVIYEVPVKSFFDADGNGTGDLRGLTEKIGYLAGLGVTAVWLLPFYPSPLRDDGYDISDYYGIHPDYGDLDDFRRLLREAHRAGIRVITELVINHTSDRHPWFRRARAAPPGSPERDFYVWSDDPRRYREARVIFRDSEAANWTWDPVARSYFWHRFYSHQPDLNFDNPQVRREIFRVLDHWFDLGIDGMRLDAIPYLYEREGTNCENLPETHAFLRDLRAHLDGRYANRMLLAEANQWPEDAAAYFGSGDECQMCFNFPVMPRLFMALTMEDRVPVTDIVEQTPAIPASCQWALFLRNHDELTLEMVTDEERDYMYRVYARDPRSRLNLGIRRRLAPLLGNDRRKIELMNVLLCSLPGTPIIYYGDEIGMGDNYYLGDRNGVRTPMQWSADRNAGFSRGNPQALFLPVIIDPEYHYEAVNVENQERNTSSLLWWTKRLIAMRGTLAPLRRGALQFLHPDNPRVLAFLRTYEGSTILVAANLSRFHQVVELDLAQHAGSVPVEVFSRNRFPPVTERPYLLTLGPHGYLWLRLERAEVPLPIGARQPPAEIVVSGRWWNALRRGHRQALEERVLPFVAAEARTSRVDRQARIVDVIPLDRSDNPAFLLLVEYSDPDAPPEGGILAVGFAAGEQAAELRAAHPEAILAPLRCSQGEGVLYDAIASPSLPMTLLDILRDHRRVKGESGEIVARAGELLVGFPRGWDAELSPRVLAAGRGNAAIAFGDHFSLKLYRRFDSEPNPDPEMIRFLSETRSFANVPAWAGSIEYCRAGLAPIALGQLEAFSTSLGDAWHIALGAASRYYEQVLARQAELARTPLARGSILSIAAVQPAPLVVELVGAAFLEQVSLIGRRVAEMHRALSLSTERPDFAPEPITRQYQRSLYQSVRSRALRCLGALGKAAGRLPEANRREAAELAAARPAVLSIAAGILERKLTGMLIRVHGNLHLEHVLATGTDFRFVDFEGDVTRSPGERRMKYSPLRDVAAMIRSFHYAAAGALFTHSAQRPQDIPLLEPHAESWYLHVSASFLAGYFAGLGGTDLLPERPADREALLRVLLADKALSEILFEIANRPDHAFIPIRGLAGLLREDPPAP